MLDALVYSSVWLALAAAALLAAAAQGMVVTPPIAAFGLAFAGTLVVYNVDRLRDLDRDRATAPDRSAFVAAHERTLQGLTAVAALASLAFTVAAGVDALWVLTPVLVVGLAHRRLKRFAWLKSAYLTAAWLAVVVGLPAALGRGPRDAGWVALVIGGAIFANAIASNLRDQEAATVRVGPGASLLVARALAAAAGAAALAGPAAVRPLVAIPLATLLVLARFRPSERYGLVAVDGALLAGALTALALR